MLKTSVSDQHLFCRIIKFEGTLLRAWVDEVRRFCVEAAGGSLLSLDLSDPVLSIVAVPKCYSSSCRKAHAPTLALNSWRS